MIPTLIDTDTLSEVARGRHIEVVKRASAYLHQFDRLTICIPTIIEVVMGWQSRRRHDRVDAFVGNLPQRFEVLPLSESTAVLAGRIRGDLRRIGNPIGAYDPLIAAIAMHHDRTLVTGNVRHYQRIIDLGYDLKLDDWREAT